MEASFAGQISRILCVGSEDGVCEQLAMKLEHLGYLIIPVSTFTGALSKINAEKFDQYILAGNLPDGTCLNLCKLIRKTDSDTSIIFYSKYHSPAIVKKALQMGANAYFNKIEDLGF